jgi:hypothetical protein
MNITLSACDKDSSAGFVKTFEFKTEKEFLEQYAEFEEEVPFSRWYLDLESEDMDTEWMMINFLLHRDHGEIV